MLRVRRVYVNGEVRQTGKTPGSVPRNVPLFERALEALEALPPRLDTSLLCPALRGGHIHLGNWRRDEWTPALRAAGIEYRVPYALRHTFISELLADGHNPKDVAEVAGTSLLQISKTYGHCIPGAAERMRAKRDAFNADRGTFGHGAGTVN